METTSNIFEFEGSKLHVRDCRHLEKDNMVIVSTERKAYPVKVNGIRNCVYCEKGKFVRFGTAHREWLGGKVQLVKCSKCNRRAYITTNENFKRWEDDPYHHIQFQGEYDMTISMHISITTRRKLIARKISMQGTFTNIIQAIISGDLNKSISECISNISEGLAKKYRMGLKEKERGSHRICVKISHLSLVDKRILAKSNIDLQRTMSKCITAINKYEEEKIKIKDVIVLYNKNI